MNYQYLDYIVKVKYIKSLLIHPLKSSHTYLLKHIKHRPTDIDIAEENNSYLMLTQQGPALNWENHGFCT